MHQQAFNQFSRCLLGLIVTLFFGCASAPKLPAPGTHSPRAGDEIVVAGQFFHSGTPVVLWLDPGGYDAYRVERRFAPFDKSDWSDSAAANKELTTPNRYGLRTSDLTSLEREEVRGGGWDLLRLQDTIDQFVIHYDASGTSRQCFKVLHDVRCLSVHFMLDLDGTIYQTLDVKERAWHASSANTRSIGIEIANIGAFRDQSPLDRWYKKDAAGPYIKIPFEPTGIRTPNFVGRPIRPEPVSGEIQEQQLLQYDLTPQQYEALARLTATLCRVFPKLRLDYPKDSAGKLVRTKLSEDQLDSHTGLIGHYHIQSN
ncbi:MAG TPA: N-acetylmuramoyl-L-alanine amidase, partial [Candidatus Kapabacteria bacterium]|nr:N-acetylmuramoyl-L-alanine amidase [Candidatus Kapabacteria bacterium]